MRRRVFRLVPNPAGRKPGERPRASMAAEALLDGELDKLTRRVIEAALDGDMVAMKLCLERVLPVRRRNALPLDLPSINAAADLLPALGLITDAAAQGALDLDAANALANLLEAKRKAIETVDLEQRIAALEQRR